MRRNMFSTTSGVEQKALNLISRQVVTIDEIIGNEDKFLTAYKEAELESFKEFTKQLKERNDYHINTIDEVFIEKFKAAFNK